MNGSMFIGTWWALVPPLLAILLAFVTKEVYSSLFIGSAVGVLLYTGFHPWDAFTSFFEILRNSMNINILIFDFRDVDAFSTVRAAGGLLNIAETHPTNIHPHALKFYRMLCFLTTPDAVRCAIITHLWSASTHLRTISMYLLAASSISFNADSCSFPASSLMPFMMASFEISEYSQRH